MNLQDNDGGTRSRISCATFLMILCGILLLSGCHSSSAGITVQILPNTAVSLDAGQSFSFTATVANDIHNQGVTWSLPQNTGCSGSGCGTLSASTNSSVTYAAPVNLTAAQSVTLTATAVANSGATATATISIVIAPAFSTTTLPNGANGVPYNQAITVTGGVSPLTFSIQSGALPPGLALNASGSVVGKPTAPAVGAPAATFSFTVVVKDSTSPAVGVTQPFTISVTPPPVLAITSTSVPAAIANTKYTAQAATTGGVTPFSWTLLPGTGAAPFNTLPPGLGLGTNSGQITGTIPQGTTAGTYNFVVQVQDSSLPSPGQVKQQALSIVVTQPQPLTVSTTVLPSGTTAVAYNASLLASGGVGPYTWSVTSGQLPSGLSLSPDGTISGAPVLSTGASPDKFTVQVQDSEATPQSISQALTISITTGSTSGNSLINGSYSFLFNGFDTNGSVIIAGSIAADGNGNITSGEEDSNRVGANNLITGIPLIGSYSLGSDGRGQMQLTAINPTTSVTVTNDYRIVLDSTGAIHFVENNDLTTGNRDTLGTHGEGIMKPVVGSFATASFNGNYSFLFAGQDTSAKPAALAGAIRADGNGNITPAAGGVSSDFNDNGAFSAQNISGSFSVGALNNRGTGQFIFQISGKSASTLQFAFYFVSPSDIYFVEIDGPTTSLSPVFYRLAGEMIAQNSSYSFTSASLSGASVVSGSGVNGSGNTTVLAGLLASSTPGSFTLNYDENNGGAITSPSPNLSGSYSVAGNGRTPFNVLGSTPALTRVAVAYLTGPGQGFFIGSDASATTGLIEQQPAATFTAASVEDGYTLSTSLPVETNVANLLGQASSDGAGNVTGIVDEIDPPTASTTEGKANLNQSLIAHINFIASNGRGTGTTNSPIGVPATFIFYVVSPAHFRAISADAGNSHPDVLFFDH